MALAILVWIAGVASARVLIDAALPAMERFTGRLAPGAAGGLSLDADIVAGLGLAAGLTGLLVALLPMWSLTVAPAAHLAGSPALTESRSRARLRQAIVVLQVAVTFALLTGAALTARSAWHLSRTDVGFDAGGVLSGSLVLHERTYHSPDLRRQFLRRLQDRLEMVPGVEAAGAIDWYPFGLGPTLRAAPAGAAVDPVDVMVHAVNPAYFEALRLGPLDGRLIDRRDVAGAARVAVIDRALADAIWSGGSPVGRQVALAFGGDGHRATPPRLLTVVGVVGTARRSLIDPTPPQIYVPLDQSPSAFLYLQVRTAPGAVDPVAAIERAILAEDPDLPWSDVQSLSTLVAAEGVRPRFLAGVLASLSVLTGAVAVMGVYGVGAWMARQRQREAAVRVALGAPVPSVTRLLAARGAIAVAAGLPLGWWLSEPTARLLAHELHGIGADDLPTRLVIAAGLTAVCLVAVWRPARRAASALPADILRQA
jgi:putative ABC transport system permease protein